MITHLTCQGLKIIGHDLKVTASICRFHCVREVLSFLMIEHMVMFVVSERVTLMTLMTYSVHF